MQKFDSKFEKIKLVKQYKSVYDFVKRKKSRLFKEYPCRITKLRARNGQMYITGLIMNQQFLNLIQWPADKAVSQFLESGFFRQDRDRGEISENFFTNNSHLRKIKIIFDSSFFFKGIISLNFIKNLFYPFSVNKDFVAREQMLEIGLIFSDIIQNKQTVRGRRATNWRGFLKQKSGKTIAVTAKINVLPIIEDGEIGVDLVFRINSYQPEDGDVFQEFGLRPIQNDKGYFERKQRKLEKEKIDFTEKFYNDTSYRNRESKTCQIRYLDESDSKLQETKI